MDKPHTLLWVYMVRKRPQPGEEGVPVVAHADEETGARARVIERREWALGDVQQSQTAAPLFSKGYER